MSHTDQPRAFHGLRGNDAGNRGAVPLNIGAPIPRRRKIMTGSHHRAEVRIACIHTRVDNGDQHALAGGEFFGPVESEQLIRLRGVG